MGAVWNEEHAELAAQLMTPAGVMGAMAMILSELLQPGLTRDQTSALIGARRCVEWFGDRQHAMEQIREHEELLEELRRTREAMREQGGGQTSFEGDPLQAVTGASAESSKH